MKKQKKLQKKTQMNQVKEKKLKKEGTKKEDYNEKLISSKISLDISDEMS